MSQFSGNLPHTQTDRQTDKGQSIGLTSKGGGSKNGSKHKRWLNIGQMFSIKKFDSKIQELYCLEYGGGL